MQVAAGARYRVSHGRTPSWEPPVNVVETDESLWVISALAGVAVDRVEVRIEGSELIIAGERPLPECCNDGELNYGKFRSAVLSGGSLDGRGIAAICREDLVPGWLAHIQLRKHS